MSRLARTYFVYGTLRPGGRYWANVQRFVVGYDPAVLHDYECWSLPEGYPAILTGDGQVFGDLLYIKSGMEEDFVVIADEIEEFDPNDPGSLYLRRPVSVVRMKTPAGPQVPAETYVFNSTRRAYLEANGTRIPDGDWREFATSGEGVQ